jgi:16S rRNA (cytosine967-C5)-methyltransferase
VLTLGSRANPAVNDNSRHLQTRLRYAITFWQQYITQNPLPPLDKWLAHALKTHKAFGKQDRRWYSEVLFACVRYAYLAAWQLRHTPTQAWHHPANLITDLRKLDPHALLSQVARRHALDNPSFDWPSVLLDAPQPAYPITDRASNLIWHGISDAYAPPLEQRCLASSWNNITETHFLHQQSVRSPLWLRINHPDKRPLILAELAQHGFSTTHDELAIAATGTRSLYELECYQSGAIEIQDRASQRVGECIKATPGQRVWDACAGGGGKTLQIAAKLANRGVVWATDIRGYKLEELRRRAKRAGFHNIRCQTWTGDHTPELPREIQNQGGFDWVLVDAPCSAAGTWRRNPDSRLRFDLADLPKLGELQDMLLQNSAGAVRSGGHLVYATCSWLVSENEDVVARFLETHPTFECVSQQLFGCPQEDADTLFAAVLRKTA